MEDSAGRMETASLNGTPREHHVYEEEEEGGGEKEIRTRKGKKYKGEVERSESVKK